VPEQYVSEAIEVQAQLRKELLPMTEETQPPNIYLLYDSNKKSCCTDIIGAKHVNSDLLVHFGEACFSEAYSPSVYYILPEANDVE
jgi:diphthamide biosynthesis protein 2